MNTSPGFSAAYWPVRTLSTATEDQLAVHRRKSRLLKLPTELRSIQLVRAAILLSVFATVVFLVLPGGPSGIAAESLAFIFICASLVFNHRILLPKYVDGRSVNIYAAILFPVPILVLAAVYRLFPLSLMAILYLSIAYVAGTICSMYHHQAIKAANKKAEAMEISLLNARINPHFIFNSLNWIYALTLDGAPEAPDAIVHLSQLMRYLIREADSPSVALEQELLYIKNYVQLQKGKLGNSVSLTCNMPSYHGTLNIAPLLLMSFIENVFKYGVNPEEDSAIDIDLLVTHNRVSLHIINNKVSSMYSTSNTGLGIDNARRRLALLYPGRYQLDILDDYKIYSVRLSIELN